MSKPLRIASWVSVLLTIVICDGAFIVIALLGALEDAVDPISETIYSALLETTGSTLWMIIPLLQILCIVFGIIAATRRDPQTLLTTRTIMLTFKLGLIPFFLCGGLLEGVLIIAGFHPIFIGFGWVAALLLGVLGWFTIFAGSMWAIATAIQLRRLSVITGSEMAVHIVLQCIFIADVIDGIVLFSRSSDMARSLSIDIPETEEERKWLQAQDFTNSADNAYTG